MLQLDVHHHQLWEIVISERTYVLDTKLLWRLDKQLIEQLNLVCRINFTGLQTSDHQTNGCFFLWDGMCSDVRGHTCPRQMLQGRLHIGVDDGKTTTAKRLIKARPYGTLLVSSFAWSSRELSWSDCWQCDSRGLWTSCVACGNITVQNECEKLANWLKSKA